MAIIDGCGVEITTIGFSVANRGKESTGWRVLPRHIWIRHIRMLRSDNADVSVLLKVWFLKWKALVTL